MINNPYSGFPMMAYVPPGQNTPSPDFSTPPAGSYLALPQTPALYPSAFPMRPSPDTSIPGTDNFTFTSQMPSLYSSLLPVPMSPNGSIPPATTSFPNLIPDIASIPDVAVPPSTYPNLIPNFGSNPNIPPAATSLYGTPTGTPPGGTLLQSIMSMMQTMGFSATQNKEEADEVKNLSENFDEIDTNKDGILEDEEMQNAGPDRFKHVLANSSSLMFASIDPGAPAWHGLSKADLTAIQSRVYTGQSLSIINVGLINQISAERGISPSPQAFQEYVERERQLIPLPPPEEQDA
jgi:hypothetical protein